MRIISALLNEWVQKLHDLLILFRETTFHLLILVKLKNFHHLIFSWSTFPISTWASGICRCSYMSVELDITVFSTKNKYSVTSLILVVGLFDLADVAPLTDWERLKAVLEFLLKRPDCCNELIKVMKSSYEAWPKWNCSASLSLSLWFLGSVKHIFIWCCFSDPDEILGILFA